MSTKNNPETLVIGKVPGYNDNINKKKTSMDLTERLKNNLTVVQMKPTGYTVNAGGISESLLTTALNAYTVVSNKGEGLIDPSNAAVGKLYNVGPTEKTFDFLGTKSALERWTALLEKTHKELKKDTKTNSIDVQVKTLQLLCTNDSTMTEVFGNDFGPGAAERLASTFSGGKAVTKIKEGIKLGTMTSSTAGLAMLEKGSQVSGNQLLNLVVGKSLGIQTALPKEWIKSSYNNSLQLMIKLVSPSGHEDDIYQHILKPLMFLILTVSPVSYDGINFGYPTIWEVEAEGMMDIKLAGVTALTITRGGNETQFNRFNQPLNIDVRMTIEPLVDGFATLTGNLEKMKFDDMLITTPQRLNDSFQEIKKYETIKL